MALDSHQNRQRPNNEELPGQKRNIGGWVVKKREGGAGKGQEGGFSAEENGKA